MLLQRDMKVSRPNDHHVIREYQYIDTKVKAFTANFGSQVINRLGQDHDDASDGLNLHQDLILKGTSLYWRVRDNPLTRLNIRILDRLI